jgi:hypothetical protein
VVGRGDGGGVGELCGEVSVPHNQTNEVRGSATCKEGGRGGAGEGGRDGMNPYLHIVLTRTF